MTEIVRLCWGEVHKLRHTILLWLHIIVPLGGSGLFLLYYGMHGWGNLLYHMVGFVEMAGFALPVLVSVLCSRAVELEEENHFQVFLGTSGKKGETLLAKWIVLQVLEAGAVVLGIGSFGVIYCLMSGNKIVSIDVWGMFMLALILGSPALYLVHLFLNLRFSKTVSMGVGVVESLVAALFVTGIGEGIWQFFPCSWGARICMCVAEGRKAPAELLVCALITVGLCVIIFVWFQFYEGRQCND